MNKIIRLLRKAYAVMPRRPRSDPIDEIVRTILSQNTSDSNSLKAFAELKKRFSSWRVLMHSSDVRIASVIRHAGLANIKAKRIKGALAEIERREGSLSLKRLAAMDTEDALRYLKSIDGVGPKTAACVLLFSFRKPVMPVDTHIYRVAGRLGLIPKDLDVSSAHEFLTRITPKSLIYDLHLGIIEHGRKTCKAQNPRCGVCLLYGLCKFKDKSLYKRRMKH